MVETLACPAERAEAPGRLGVRFTRCHALRFQLLGAELQVKPDLVIRVGAGAA